MSPPGRSRASAEDTASATKINLGREEIYDASTLQHSTIRQLIDHVQLKVITLWQIISQGKGIEKRPLYTLFPTIFGPGNVPPLAVIPATTVLGGVEHSMTKSGWEIEDILASDSIRRDFAVANV